MTIWEVDFYRRPLQDETGHPLWEWVVCDAAGDLRDQQLCPQQTVSIEWVWRQLERLLYPNDRSPGRPSPPTKICVFRPQTFNLLDRPCRELGITLEPTRHTPQLKQTLQNFALRYPLMPGYTHQAYDPLALDYPPPVPLADDLLGQQWQFASLLAGDLEESFSGRMIPILDLPDAFLPLKLGLASTVSIPGVVIEAGRRSLKLAQWLQAIHPVALNYSPGNPNGLILNAGLVDRWIMATFTDQDVAHAAQTFEHRKQSSQGLHFLLIQPDNSGMTYSGFWLLKQEE